MKGSFFGSPKSSCESREMTLKSPCIFSCPQIVCVLSRAVVSYSL